MLLDPFKERKKNNNKMIYGNLLFHMGGKTDKKRPSIEFIDFRSR